MEIEDSNEEGSKEEYEEEKVDYREELLSAIEVIKREKKKNKSLQEELKKKEESQNSKEVEQTIMKLKLQVEEDKRIKEALRGQLEERDRTIEGLEAEIVTLRKDLQKKDMQQNNTKILDNIINSQRPYYERSGLGYNQTQTEKGSSSKMIEQEAEPRSYAEIVRGPSKEEDMKTQGEDYRDTAPPRRFKSQYQQQPAIEIPQEEEGFRRATPFKKIFYSQVSNYFSWFMLFML
jgi:hypothetical protein